jgi:hypothetical protein
MLNTENNIAPPTLLTVTWSGDLDHFAMLRQSLSRSALANCPHLVIVQSEDLALFEKFRAPGLTLTTSADVLPAEVEERRRNARRQQQRWGRRGTVLAGSLARHLGWPRWVRYTGWHTQQLCKLAAAASTTAQTLVAMDSDLIVTPHARLTDFVSAQTGIVHCFEHWLRTEQLSRKVQHWQHSARRLLQLPEQDKGHADAYYDTPFIFDKDAVNGMLEWLECRYQQPWWQSLVNCPPRQWSEFGLYRAWLRHYYRGTVQWQDVNSIGYLYDASNLERLSAEFRELVHGRHCHYVTIHSQSSGRQNWHPENYAETLMGLLDEPGL